MRRARGITLIELVIAAAITSAVMAMALSVVGTGVRISRQAEQTTDSNDAARQAMQMVLRDLRLAGVPAGLWVSSVGGPPFKINPIFSQPGPSGADDLWVVVPRPNAMQGNCASKGSAAVVIANGTGTLRVNCTQPLNTTDTLMVTNHTSAMLISGVAFPTTGSITYAEQTSGIQTSPTGNHRGDMVMPVEIVRYQVRPSVLTGRPELVREVGAIAPAPTSAAPFVVNPGALQQAFANVEDLQVAFGTGLPPALTFASAHNPVFDPAAPPLSVRVSVVGITPRTIINEAGQRVQLGPVTVEDHVAAVVNDGYRRSVFRRRVELVNMSAVSL